MRERLINTRVPTPEAWSGKGKQNALGKNIWLLPAKGIRKHCYKNLGRKLKAA